MRQAKYIQIAEAFQRRIHNGDYTFSTLPGAQRLAAEVGVSYLTARQSIQKLIGDGILRRQQSGRLAVCSSTKNNSHNLKAALIIPVSYDGIWSNAIRKTAQTLKCNLRTISYSHDDDPVIFEALNGDFDIIFISFVRTDKLFIDKLLQHKDKVVTLFHDFTDCGIRCIDGPSPNAIGKLMEYMCELGHEKIDFLNTQPSSPTITERIKSWKNSKNKLKFSGKLHDHPVQSFNSATLQAYLVTHKLLSDKKFNATAIFSSSVDAASGILRACFEKGVGICEDLSVCSFGQPEIAKMLIPSITVIDRPSPEPEIIAVFEQFLKISATPDKLLFRPEPDEKILIGESTCKI